MTTGRTFFKRTEREEALLRLYRAKGLSWRACARLLTCRTTSGRMRPVGWRTLCRWWAEMEASEV